MFSQSSAEKFIVDSRTQTRIGFDLVQVSQIQNSLDRFGDAFRQRLFTDAELAYAGHSKSLEAQRLAARFAAKEAVIKALDLSDAGINWRDIEAKKLADGSCCLELHGKAAACAAACGVLDSTLSLSHDGDYAGAFVVCVCAATGLQHFGINNFNRSPCGSN